MAEWTARLIGWKIGVGGLLAMPFKIYRKYKNDENMVFVRRLLPLSPVIA